MKAMILAAGKGTHRGAGGARAVLVAVHDEFGSGSFDLHVGLLGERGHRLVGLLDGVRERRRGRGQQDRPRAEPLEVQDPVDEVDETDGVALGSPRSRASSS
jgi:hypothetical protein